MTVPLISQVGAEAVSSFFNDAVRAFQRSKARQMRIAANLVRDDARRKAEAVVRPRGLRAGWTPRQDSKGRKYGPLVKKIRARVKLSRADVYAVIGPTRLAFYGRFLEAGVDQQVSRTSKRGKVSSYHLRIVARPFLEPAARVNAAKVQEIIGDAYDVFTKSGAVGISNQAAQSAPLTGRAAYWANYRSEKAAMYRDLYSRRHDYEIATRGR